MSDQFAPKNNLIIVAYDFTKEADCSLNHANNLAKATASTIELVYIITKDTKDKNVANAALQKVADDNAAKSGITTKATAKEGDIFSTIGEIAEERNAWYLTFGTHGVKGMQHILGAFALKVVSSSPCPVIIVQNKGVADHGYKNILLPIDRSTESKQKVYQAITLAKLYNCNIHLFGDHEKDEYLAVKLKANMSFVKNKLEEHDLSVASEAYVDATSKDSFSKQTIKHASANNIDLMLIIAAEEKGIVGAIVGAEDVKIINNDAQIPVMCINPTNFQILGSIISFGGFS
ncbi:MAG: universal stress protein [Bacteroidota bacterium]